jgi:hypothetical protein
MTKAQVSPEKPIIDTMSHLAFGWLMGAILAVFSCVLASVALGPLVSLIRSAFDSSSTPTPAPCPPVPPQWIMVTGETFTSNINDWPTGPDSNKYSASNMQIGHGTLTYSVEAKQDVYSYRYPHVQRLTDFYLEADVRQVSGPADSFYGLVFRVSDWRHYFFAISDNGDLVVRKRADQGGWSSMVQFAPTAHVDPGKRNTMTILAQGSHFVFCINHYVLAELEDADFQEGEVGIGLSLSKQGDRATLEYTRYKVFAPPQ